MSTTPEPTSSHSPTRRSLSPTKQALIKIRELKQKLADVENSQHEDIAIISMACRFPRHSDSPEAFWNSLISGSDELREVPSDRWDLEAYFDADPDAIGRMYAREGAFLDNLHAMDAEFFGISPREATWIDPQQRLLLEVGWEALERAGWPSDQIGDETGMFVGWMHNDYQNECSDSLLNLNPYIATGSAGSFLCGRLSYQLGLRGPSIAVDTACSSSLVALHLACQSIQRRDCDRALVGGVNAMISPKTTVLTCKLRALSPHGHSRAFDASADGYVRGEGCGVVALRRLSDAQREGDPILAVIRGTAVCHNGASSGLTVPNGKAQERVLRDALQHAGVSPRDVAYLEAHGTGTELGDPIEMQAAAAVLGEGRSNERPLLVGSVKTNIGHLEAAAGIAGLIKTVLALQHGRIPAHLHFENPNPHIPWEQIPVRIVGELTEWPPSARKIAGVSAFGMSGTNAHVVLESPPEDARPERNSSAPEMAERSHHVLALSGKTEDAVQQLAGRFLRWLEQEPDVNLADVCYSAGVGRRHLERRAALIVESSEQTRELLRELQRGATAAGLFRGQARTAPTVAWQFTGQGSQYVGMARRLYATQRVFREALDRFDKYFRRFRERSLLDVMFRQEALLNQTYWTQPGLLALELGLVELLNSWGLYPDLVLGHSVGQFTAACVAGILSWEDGLRLISERARRISALPAGGAMAAVFASADRVEQVIASDESLSLAAYNGAHAVISGPEPAVLQALDSFQHRSIRVKRLNTSHAFHSALMDPALDAFQQTAETIEYRPAQLPLVCNLTGDVLPAHRILDGEYWRNHIRQPVRFADSIRTLSEMGCQIVLELGPQPVLTNMAASCWPGPPPAFLSSLEGEQDDFQAMMATVAQLYVHGAAPDFAAFDKFWQRQRVQLPTYPFQRQTYWGPAKPQDFQAERGKKHPLLGSQRALAGLTNQTRFENWVNDDNPRWLSDHRVLEDVVFPGAAYVEMAIAATGGSVILQDLSFEVPLRFTDSTCLQTIVESGAKETTAIEIHSLPEQSRQWTRNFTATGISTPEQPEAVQRADLEARCPHSVDVTEFYQALFGFGLQYGPGFQTLQSLSYGDNDVLGRLKPVGDARGYFVSPTLLDGAFQSLAVGLTRDPEASLFLPIGIERVHYYGPIDGEIWVHAQWREAEGDVRTADLTLCDDEGAVLMRVERLKLRAISRAALRQMAGSGPERLVYSLRWRPTTLEDVNKRRHNWLVIRDAQAPHTPVAEQMEGYGQRCVRVQLGTTNEAPSEDNGTHLIKGSDPQSWLDLFERVFSPDEGSRPEGVVWLVGGFGGQGERPLDEAERTERICSSVLGLLHALRDKKVEWLDRGFQFVTEAGIAAEPGEPVSPCDSQFWGFGRVISAEHPGLRCRIIDVEDLTTSSELVTDVLLCDSRENQIALRSGQQYIPRLLPLRGTTAECRWSAEEQGCYLITGGLGKLGLQAARWLSRRGAQDLILVSRRGPTEATQELIAEIEQTGCRVHVQPADISQREDVAHLFQQIQASLPPLKGVIHAAGVLDDGLLAEQTWPRFEKVLRPKKEGAWLLHEATANLPLDFFIIYSSASSVLGSPGQANYATANAFLDGLAQQRVTEGLPALSVNWGPWTEGMAASETVVRSLALQGITPLTADESHTVLEQLLTSEATQATVIDVDWRRLRLRIATQALPVLDEVAPDEFRANSVASELIAKLRKSQGAARKRLLTSHVQHELQQILSLAEPPAPDTPLAELGLDSLMALELSTRLQLQLEPEIAVSPTIVFDYPSAGALTDHLLNSLDAIPEPATSTSAAAPVEVSREDIAIIGLGCRFPGADNLDEFWDLLRDGIDAVGEIPAGRWDLDKYFSREQTPGKMVTREGGFLDAIGDFDAEFFGISPQEACWIDPQHRLLLEVSWEALEDAGMAPHQIPDRQVGVFMGLMSRDYAELPVDHGEDLIDSFQGAGLAHSAGVGRISYLFGFEGPSVAVDSASSSSLVAVCQAAKSLLDGDCNLALAGGANAILSPTNFLLLCKAGMLSPDGRCKSFSAAADGFGRGEGCGVVVLKRLSDAERDGDRISAVIRGSAVAHNGFSGSLTAPSGRAQEQLIRKALDRSGVRPADVDYLEAHGTGTELGDPVELRAAATVLGQGRSAERPLLVGSVKANIGHLEAAGGISGLIKVVLSMQHRLLPRQIHFEQPSPHIAWDKLPVKMVLEPTPWPADKPRTAGVTALGMSGTNAHLVLESPPPRAPSESQERAARAHHLLVLSGKSEESLQRIAQRYGDWFDQSASHVELADACYTAAVGRRHFEYRAAMTISSKEDARRLLQSLAQNQNHPRVFCDQASDSPKVAWMFSGEGPKSLGIGRSLYDAQPLFREVLDRCQEHLESDHETSLLDALFDDASLLERPSWNQPGLFALQMGLANLWRSWGIEPDLVLGQGLGQYAAACVAGVMSLDDGLRLAVQRGRLTEFEEVPQANALSPAALQEFEEFADTLDYFPADRPLICNLSGEIAPVHRVLGGSHWKRHCTEPDRFADSLMALAEQECDIVLELGPQAKLREMAANCWEGKRPILVASLGDCEHETESLLAALGRLYVSGLDPNFAAFDQPWPRRKVKLPTYPFQRRRYWITDAVQCVTGG